MTKNVPGTRPVNRPDEPVRVEPTPTPVTNPTGVSGVAVYDRGSDAKTNSSAHPSMSLIEEPASASSMSTGTIVAWIIGIVVLVVLAYFLWQMYF